MPMKMESGPASRCGAAGAERAERSGSLGGWPRRSRSIARALTHLCAFTSIAFVNAVHAEELPCPASTIEAARALADRMLEAGEDEAAGKCYEAAGEYHRANVALLKAVTPQSKAAERQFADRTRDAKKFVRQVERAFRGRP